MAAAGECAAWWWYGVGAGGCSPVLREKEGVHVGCGALGKGGGVGSRGGRRAICVGDVIACLPLRDRCWNRWFVA